MVNPHAAILATLPASTVRVQVSDAYGHVKFKAVADILPTDTILNNSAGVPIVMTAKPGRKTKPNLQPANDNIAEMLRAKEQHVDSDPLFGVIRQNPELGTVLDYVMSGLAEEAASLGFERTEAERKGESTSQISMRRINALKAVGDSWIKRKEQIASGGVDLDSPAFKRLLLFIMETLRGCLLDDVRMRPEMVETIFSSFSRRFDDDWKRDAVKKMSEG